MPSALTRSATVAALALPMSAGLVATAAASPVASAVVAPVTRTPVTHPDRDHMGSTVRAHSPVLAGQHLLAPRLMATGVQPYGMDVSSFQGDVDWTTAAAQGAKFVYIKASEDTGYVNPFFNQQYGGSYAAGLMRGAYHFALPNNSSGATQAAYFLAHGGGWAPDGHTLPPMLDIEYNPYGSTCYGLTPAQMSYWIRDFSNTVHARTGEYPTIYSTRDWWDTCTGYNGSFAATNPLFIANYSGSIGAMPAGWGYQTIWQYADHGAFPGDADVFNGTLSQLRQFAGTPAVPQVPHLPPPPPPPPADPLVARWFQFGFGGGYLGGMVGGEYAVSGGTAQNYDGGRMYYSRATGAHIVRGSILARYLALGGPSRLGLPTTDETSTPDGIGRYNHFSGFGGASIYSSPASGTHEIQGQIRQLWAMYGWERGPLGYPTTDETSTPDNVGRYNHFSRSNASIYWSNSTGANAVQGKIAIAWEFLGWERGRLGYPTSSAYTAPSGLRNSFQRGTITWTPSTGAIGLRYS